VTIGDEEDPPQEELWRLYHETAKLERFAHRPADLDVAERMADQRPAFSFPAYPALPLPAATPLAASLDGLLAARRTARGFTPSTLARADLSALLKAAAGVNRPAGDRPLRTAPSGGALYPVELFAALPEGPAGPARLTHYDPLEDRLAILKAGAAAEGLADLFAYPRLAAPAAGVFLFVGVFARSTFKYGERGYRFTLLEAGHMAQSLLLAAAALGLAAAPLGGFFDRDLDAWLGLDGSGAGVLYAVAVGQPL
jgi:SagB-type dehydrogenase family enzyme